MTDLDGLRIANNKLYPASINGYAVRFIGRVRHEPWRCFRLSMRVHCDGSFTKDYLPIIDEMADPQLVTVPVYCPARLKNPKPTGTVLDYFMHCIRYERAVDNMHATNHCWRSVA